MFSVQQYLPDYGSAEIGNNLDTFMWEHYCHNLGQPKNNPRGLLLSVKKQTPQHTLQDVITLKAAYLGTT